jgi:O-antigen/teichoic acid export membrane protein
MYTQKLKMETAAQFSPHDGRQLSLDWIASNIHTVVMLAAAFVTVRLLTHNVPRAEYGFWLTAGNIASYLLIVQRGTSAALMRASAEGWARRDPVLAAHSFRLLTNLLGLCAGLGILASAGGALAVKALFGPSGAALTFWTFVYTSASMMLGAVNAYLSGLSWYAAGRAVLIASAVGNLALTVLFVWLATPLWVLAALQAGWTLLLALVAGTLAFWRLHPLVVPHFRFAGARQTLDLLYTGTGFLLTDLGYMIAYQSDSILVASLLGPSLVVPLSLLQRIAATLHTILGAQHSPLVPAMMKLQAVDARPHIRAAYLTQMRRFGGVAVIFGWGLCCFGRDLIGLWVGPQFYAGWDVNFWVAIAFLAVALYRPTGLTLCAMGLERRCGVTAVAEALVNVGLSVVLILRMGVAGTVLATALSQVFVSHVPLLGMLYRRLQIPLRSYLTVIFRPWGLAFLVLAVATLAAALGPGSSYWRMGVAAIAGTTSLILGWRTAWAPVPPEGLTPSVTASSGPGRISA